MSQNRFVVAAVLSDSQWIELDRAFEDFRLVVEVWPGEQKQLKFAALLLVLEPIGFQPLAPTGLPRIQTGSLEFAQESDHPRRRVVLAHVSREDVVEVRVAVDRVRPGDEPRDFVLAERNQGQKRSRLCFGNLAFRRGDLRRVRVRRTEPGRQCPRTPEKVPAVDSRVVDRLQFHHAVHQWRVFFHVYSSSGGSARSAVRLRREASRFPRNEPKS